MSAVMQKVSPLSQGMIKFSHSVFASVRRSPLPDSGLSIPSLRQIFWITVAMVGARSGAMGLNRIIDRKIDTDNPRTAAGKIPEGL